MLLLARVIGWINVSYREWSLPLNLNDGRSACPTVVVHFGRCFAESARRSLDCLCLIEFVAHSDVEVARYDGKAFGRWMIMRGNFITARHFQAKNEGTIF